MRVCSLKMTLGRSTRNGLTALISEAGTSISEALKTRSTNCQATRSVLVYLRMRASDCMVVTRGRKVCTANAIKGC